MQGNNRIILSSFHIQFNIIIFILLIKIRSADRFYSRVDEPRPTNRRGNIPGSTNVPFGMVLTTPNSKDQFITLKSEDEIKKIFQDHAKVDLSKQITTSCGSGVTASLLTFSLYWSGVPMEKLSVYDGSWSEWGNPALNPKFIN